MEEISYNENLVIMTVMNNRNWHDKIRYEVSSRLSTSEIYRVIRILKSRKVSLARESGVSTNDRDDLNWELIGAECVRQFVDAPECYLELVNRYNQKQYELNRPPLTWRVCSPVEAEVKTFTEQVKNLTAEVDTLVDPKTEEIEMSATKTYETRHYINGTDVNDMSDDQMIEAIRELENRINHLKAIEVQSKVIQRKIKEAQKGIKFIVKHLDVR